MTVPATKPTTPQRAVAITPARIGPSVKPVGAATRASTLSGASIPRRIHGALTAARTMIGMA